MANYIDNFQLLSKPTGSLCNIDCDYCYYLEKEALYPERNANWKMDAHTLESYVSQQVRAQQADVVDFIWQGGEPLLAGIEFYKKAVALQQRYANGKQINNYFQTNGIRLTAEWAMFFKQYHFLVGISVDGNNRHHDHYRKSKSGKPTFKKVKAAIERLIEHDVEFNTLTVVSQANAEEPLMVYNSLKKLGARYMQFIPLVERLTRKPTANGLQLIAPAFAGQSTIAPWSVPAEQYGKFLNVIFREWAQRDIGQYFVMNFEQTMAQLAGFKGSCVFEPECGANLALEANGDVYSCDHFVYPEHKIGNINEDDLGALVNSEQQIRFSKHKAANIDSDCVNCEVKEVCNGGCPKHRFMPGNNGLNHKNYFCQSYKEHFGYALPQMKKILARLRGQA